MKCYELKDRWFTAYPVEGDQLIEVEVYGRKEVDETIAELIDANEKCQDITQQCFKREVEFRKRIDELNTKNQNSKRELCATKRALWLARALALSRFDVDEYLRKYTHCNSRFWNDGFNTFNEACEQMQKAINIAEAKCRAKAKEYK